MTKADEPSTLGQSPPRIVTAAALFDGHDASINIMRRLIQAGGAEVIHLGHNRGVDEVALAALQEDADGIAISSYQGGHMEYFSYLVARLDELGIGHVRIFGGGGGVITEAEARTLHERGVERIYGTEDGRALGLQGMIDDLLARVAKARGQRQPKAKTKCESATAPGHQLAVARSLTAIEQHTAVPSAVKAKNVGEATPAAPVLGITGPGGSGKSSLTDELLARLLRRAPELHVALLCVDPTRRRTGGALLGDRIRFNSAGDTRVFIRSVATRRSHLATNEMLGQSVSFLRQAGFDLVLVETAGIGQSDSEIVDLADLTLYVMTPEYGAASQLEKIDMLDYADMVALNKFEKRGGDDALRDIRKQWRRNHAELNDADEVPVFPTVASRFLDPGVDKLCEALFEQLTPLWSEKTATSLLGTTSTQPNAQAQNADTVSTRLEELGSVIPPARIRYMAEISELSSRQDAELETQIDAASRAGALYTALTSLGLDEALPTSLMPILEIAPDADDSINLLVEKYNAALDAVPPDMLKQLCAWPARIKALSADTYSYTVRGREITGSNFTETLSGLKLPKVAAPSFRDPGDRLRFLARENFPGSYPYTAGIYPYKRKGEDPTRMFAGEGKPERTNRRFHYLCAGQKSARLSTAFDSATLYGADPDRRPDIYGKIGNSGVSICTIDDMKRLYSGFDLCAPTTSVSMTINGPAPIALAFFMNTAIDQAVERHLRESGQLNTAVKQAWKSKTPHQPVRYRDELPAGHDGSGLALLGLSGRELVSTEIYERLREATFKQVRGTIQADILKEDQAQNTCIFSTPFALRMMADVQEFFIAHGVRNYYSVSISGYHIAEAGANPISQLAFTLANGFTMVEYYLARGMAIDDFASSLSFFFSNGLDAEYSVIGRVSRRIWARAMRERYGASSRSQMLKYHIQTSGRSLHAQEIHFNDIRTTLQALFAIYDNCNSLHTNAYDEAITTPTEESVRRAVAIQLIINRELGLCDNENPLQGAFVIRELTDLVEAAVYAEFERISERGGVLGAMETMYQRSRIQEESLEYERRKHDGTLPIIGVNTFLSDDREAGGGGGAVQELIRSTQSERDAQIDGLREFQNAHTSESGAALERLSAAAKRGENTFGVLMDTVTSCSIGQICGALFDVGGRYRRAM